MVLVQWLSMDVLDNHARIVDQLEQPIRLEPMSTFPVIRDLQVDRTRMFDNLKRMKAWIPIDGTYDLGPGPRMPEKNVKLMSYLNV